MTGRVAWLLVVVQILAWMPARASARPKPSAGVKAGAGAKQAAPDAAPRAEAPTPTTCDGQIAELEQWLATVPTTPSVVSAPIDELRLVDEERPLIEPVRGSLFIQMRTGAAMVEGRAYGTELTPEELPPLLQQAARQASGRRGTWPVVLVIDRDRPWSDVVDVVGAIAAAGFRQIDFAFRRSFRAVPPSSALDGERDRIAKLDFIEQSSAAGDLADRSLKACAPAKAVLDGIAGIDPDLKVRKLASEMPAALRKCACSVPARDVMTVIWLSQQPDPDVVIRRAYIGARVSVPKPGEQAVAVRARKTAKWSEVTKMIPDPAAPGKFPAIRFEATDQSAAAAP